MKKSGIYIFKNMMNDKVYIGQSVNIESRVKEHKYRGSLLFKAIKKYGWNNFYYEILEECDRELLDDREEFYIEKYNSTDKNIGYNILKSAKDNPVSIGSTRTLEVKKLISEKLLGKNVGEKNGFYGKTHSDEFKKRQSERKSKEYLKEGNPFFGKKHSEETIHKLKEIRKDRDMSFCNKRVIQIDKITNEVIKIWDSIADAAEQVLGDRKNSSISAACKGKYKSAGGFIWKYE